MKYLYILSLVGFLIKGPLFTYDNSLENGSNDMAVTIQDSIPSLDSISVLDEVVVSGMKSKIKRVLTGTIATVTESNCFTSITPLATKDGNEDEALNEVPNLHNSELVDDSPTEELDIKEAGILTASEWHDLDNWNTWKSLCQDDVYKQVRTIWNLPLGDRIPVLVTNDQYIPVPNMEVSLVDDDGTQLWQGITDHKGKVELWLPNTNSFDRLTLSCAGNLFSDLVFSENTAQHIVVDHGCEVYDQVDIMFVVDATGSMKDEIDYLIAELGDVIKRAADQEDMTIRTGAVLYKDKWDDYLFATTPLNEDTQLTLDFFRKYHIGGGGDYPEAVDVGIEKALEQDWNEEALSRIIFLLLDAPPHNNPEVSKRLQKQIQEAAARGIKLVPITASGIDRETEYLMKQMAMMTNGTYVFLTDDSGVGETHLVHAVPDYDVEQLNDLLVRLISAYSQQVACDTDWQESDKQVIQQPTLSMNLYPNPATTAIKVRTNTSSGYLTIVNANGNEVLKKGISNGIDQGEYTLPVADLVAGIYTVRVVDESGRQSALPLFVVN